MSKKHHEIEKLLCIPQEQRSSSMKVGETPGTGEESPTFGEGPFAGDGDVPDREGAAGVLDDAVAGVADRAETFRDWTGDEPFRGDLFFWKIDNNGIPVVTIFNLEGRKKCQTINFRNYGFW